jgi:hypothetical protein
MAEEQDDGVKNMMDVFDAQIQMQGIGCITVKDGTMLMLPVAALEQILEKAKASKEQRALVFVKRTVGS